MRVVDIARDVIEGKRSRFGTKDTVRLSHLTLGKRLTRRTEPDYESPFQHGYANILDGDS